jgi:hypothetical protein
MHRGTIIAAGAIALLLAGCDAGDGTGKRAPAAPAGAADQAASAPPAPARPLTEAGPADIVRHYYALIGERRYGEAWKLWGDGGKASGRTAAAFAAAFADVKHCAATVGPPGAIEGAAGSLYVTVPVEVNGEKVDGAPIHIAGEVTLRRVNNVPGSTPEQRQWHISAVPG